MAKPAGEISVPSPTALAFGDNGLLFVSSRANGGVYKCNINYPTELVEVGKGVLTDPVGVMVDGDALYVADHRAGKIVKFSLDGSSHEVFANLELPMCIRLGPDGNIYVTQCYDLVNEFIAKYGKGRVIVFSKEGMLLRSFHADSSYGLAFNTTGNILVSDWRSLGNGIREFTPEGHSLDCWGGITAFMVFGICTDNDDNTYITTFPGGVTKYDSKHDYCATYLGDLFCGFHLSDVEVGPDGLVYVADIQRNAVLRFEL